VIFDSNGSNTTAAAAVAWLAHGRSLAGKRAVVLGGSGPVGQRAAVLLAREGASVCITGRKRAVAQAACDSILALHRACIARLFERNDLLLDAEEIYAIAKTMVGENAQKP